MKILLISLVSYNFTIRWWQSKGETAKKTHIPLDKKHKLCYL